MKKESKIGVLGGTFNPSHFGHLIIGKRAIKVLDLKKLLLMVSGKPPLKSKDLASVKDRLEMAKILASYDPHFQVSKIEIARAKKGKTSYTIETIKELKKRYPEKEIYWIIGEDSLKEILEGKWKGGISILSEAKFVVITRPGYKIKKFPKKILAKISARGGSALGGKIIKLKIPISSTEIRKKIKEGQNVSKMVPPKILEYIEKKKLYKERH